MTTWTFDPSILKPSATDSGKLIFPVETLHFLQNLGVKATAVSVKVVTPLTKDGKLDYSQAEESRVLQAILFPYGNDSIEGDIPVCLKPGESIFISGYGEFHAI